jgi:hypothetical protein
MRSYLKKNPSQKRASGVAQGVGPAFNPQYRNHKQTNKNDKGGGGNKGE